MNDVIKKNGLLFGTILSAYYIVTTLIMFFFNQQLFVSIPFGFASIFVSLALGVVALFAAKKKLQGYITFKDAFTSYFITIVLGLLSHIIITFLLFNLVDPAAKETIKALTIAFTETNMSSLQVEPETIAKTVEQIRESDNFNLGNLLKSFAWKTLLYSVGGMLIALIFRNQNEPTR
ncbi:DUF4199 domain-containing protein [Flavobacterium sp. JP2137]|uniref:DUF4199 domain-containing protein n=1 Tax=Flavobacterium sp. JP2137 TaxID=3414510 RepID=UPI003D300F1B